MRKSKAARIVVWFIVISVVAAFVIDIARAQETVPPPQNVSVKDIGYTDRERQEWFIEFEWNKISFPNSAVSKYQDFYFNKVERGTGRLREDVTRVSLNENIDTFNPGDFGIELDSGTIYEFYGRNRYTYGEYGQYTYTSGRSNRVKFLTGLEVEAELIHGTNNIRIVWDDVWDTDGRINYRILISDTKDFNQPPVISDIIGSEIGTEKSRVTVSGNKLEYIYNALPGREYSIKVIPLVKPNVVTVPENELPVITVRTEIILRAKYLGDTIDKENNMTWQRWMLYWDPVIKGPLIGEKTFNRVQYRIYRFDRLYSEDELTEEYGKNDHLFAVIEDNDFTTINNYIEIKISPEDAQRYTFSIVVDAYRPDSTVPVTFYSYTQISLKIQVPEYPVSPEFVDRFDDAYPEPLVFDELLTDTSATLLWLPPYTADGTIDNEIYYDLYLCEDLEDVGINKIPPSSRKIASNIRMGTQNQVRKSKADGEIIGYRYKITNLEPNKVYYAVLVAKKNYLVQSGEFMVTMPFVSQPAIKVIITKPGISDEKPYAPPSPPFGLKPGDAIGIDRVSLKMEKTWTEWYNSEKKKWEYDDGSVNNNAEKRVVSYKTGWEIRIHCVDYATALNKVKEIKGRDYIAYGDLKENYLLSLQLPMSPVKIPEIEPGKSSIFYFDAYGLRSNTTYLIWITVYNPEGNVESDPSDPLIVTTLPELPSVIEYPTVPTDLKGIAGDTYVDLYWTFREGYSYNIRYGTEDDINKAAGTITVTYDQLLQQPYVRVEQLKPNTVYYFWIQAVSPAELGGLPSDWSTSIVVKTEPYSPPPRPRGFGIKNTPDAITENSIFYEWIPDERYTFILEISENPDFSESTEYHVDGSEYRVTGLKSNFAYYARLYSYSAETGLRSEPTSVIAVITRKGRSEYDANVPRLDEPKGDIVVKHGVAVDGIWTARAVGINAHRLSEKVRDMNVHTFSIDMTNPPPGTRIIRVELGGEAVETLSGTMKNLIIKTPDAEITITPGSFLKETYFRLKQSFRDIVVRIDARTPVSELKPENSRQYVIPVTEIKVTAGAGESFFPVGEFARPVMVSFSVEPEKTEKAETRFYDYDVREWHTVRSLYVPEERKLRVYPEKSGAIAVTGINYVRNANSGDSMLDAIIRNITSKYEMPSLSAKNANYSRQLTINEGLKLLFDIIPYDYGNSDVTEKAVRAGLLPRQYVNSGSRPMRKDEAIHAAVSVLRKKIGIDMSDAYIPPEYDGYMNLVQEPFRDAVAFAIANGILDGYTGEMNLGETITLYELLAIIERILVFAGEI